ncbi:RCC1/BLIP-II [Auriculariales sp. MPI-PUGE-AT-0066]|nr:RCC1/BLIP-II [Auriculariales sp. MPI-PUGE-AT-0066]
MPAHIQDLPVELLIDNLLPALALRDLLALASTNKFFTVLVNDDTFWKLKLEREFNFTSRETARSAGWKAIYRGMKKPQVYVWGAATNGRLGNGKSGYYDASPSPVRPALKPADGAGIASLAAGGWSFHAIDTKGRLYAWGELNERWGGGSDGFADSSETAPYPIRLDIPETRFTYVSCGRAHAHVLDSTSQIWLFTAWGAGMKLKSDALDGTSPDTSLVQVESGWTSGFALTESGAVLAWWPDAGRMDENIQALAQSLSQENPAVAHTVDDERVVTPSVTDLQITPITLPDLPQLPPLAQVPGNPKLVKIAAADNFIIGLTNAGHVLKMDTRPARERFSPDESTVPPPLAQWEYLPKFSDRSAIAANSAYDASQGGVLSPPESVVITHLRCSPQISANFHTFFAYSTGASSSVLQGGNHTSPSTDATILPTLQNNGVISVVLGDYHWGALTEDGSLYTWGSYSDGALGLGDPFSRPPGPGGFVDIETRDALRRTRFSDAVLPVEVPTKVDFGPGRFVIGATAAGWHSGALVIDLEHVDAIDQEVAELHDKALAETTEPGFSGVRIASTAHPGDPNSIFTSPPLIPPSRGGGGMFPIGRFGGRGGPGQHPITLPVQPPQLASTRGVFPFRVGFAGRGARLGGPGRTTGAGTGDPATS